MLTRGGLPALWVILIMVPLACCTDSAPRQAASLTPGSVESSNDPVTLLVGEAAGEVLVVAAPFEVSASRQGLLKDELAHKLEVDPESFEPWSVQIYNFVSSPPAAYELPPAGQRLAVRTTAREFRERNGGLSPKEGGDPLVRALMGPAESLAVPDGRSLEVLVLMEPGLKIEDCLDGTLPSSSGAVTLRPKRFFRSRYEDFVSQPKPGGLSEIPTLSSQRPAKN